MPKGDKNNGGKISSISAAPDTDKFACSLIKKLQNVEKAQHSKHGLPVDILANDLKELAAEDREPSHILDEHLARVFDSKKGSKGEKHTKRNSVSQNDIKWKDHRWKLSSQDCVKDYGFLSDCPIDSSHQQQSQANKGLVKTRSMPQENFSNLRHCASPVSEHLLGTPRQQASPHIPPLQALQRRRSYSSLDRVDSGVSVTYGSNATLFSAHSQCPSENLAYMPHNQADEIEGQACESNMPCSRRKLGNVPFVYQYDDCPVPYVVKVAPTGGCCCAPQQPLFTLHTFRLHLPKKGQYRFFFKTFNSDLGSDVYEELTEGDEALPLYEGKVISQICKAD